MSIYDIVSLTAQHQLWLSLSFIDQLKHFSCTAFSAWWRTVWLSLALTCCHFSSHFQWLSAIAEHSHRMKDRSNFVQVYNMYWCKRGSVLIYVSSVCRAQRKGLARLGWLWCIHTFMHARRIQACPECRTYLMMHYRGCITRSNTMCIAHLWAQGLKLKHAYTEVKLSPRHCIVIWV